MPGAATSGPSRGVSIDGDAGEVGERDAGRRKRVAYAAFQFDVGCMGLRLKLRGGAEIGARGHDAEDVGEPGHAHGVGRMRRLSRVQDDVEDLALGKNVDAYVVKSGTHRDVAPRVLKVGSVDCRS